MCPSYLDGDPQLLAQIAGDTRSYQPLCDGRYFVGMIMQFSRSASRRHPDWADGLSKLNSMPVQTHEPGPVDVRYRVKLEADGMSTWLSPALQVLELP